MNMWDNDTDTPNGKKSDFKSTRDYEHSRQRFWRPLHTHVPAQKICGRHDLHLPLLDERYWKLNYVRGPSTALYLNCLEIPRVNYGRWKRQPLRRGDDRLTPTCQKIIFRWQACDEGVTGQYWYVKTGPSTVHLESLPITTKERKEKGNLLRSEETRYDSSKQKLRSS